MSDCGMLAIVSFMVVLNWRSKPWKSISKLFHAVT
jgi:hypothetical protein